MKKFAIGCLLFAVFMSCALICCNAASSGNEWLRYFEARNAIANMMLVPPGTQQQAVSAERPDCLEKMTCPVCFGKGDVILQEPDYGQWAGRLNKGGKRERTLCPLCNGKKYWRAYISPKELYAAVAQARNTFIATHQAAGDIPIGQAYVPRNVHESAGRKDLKLAEDAYGKPCTRCNWTGIEECKKCKGDGTVKCANKECKTGWIVTKTVMEHSSSGRSHGYSRHGRSQRTRRETVTVTQCPECKGAARLICPDCNGTRADTCSKCNGLGFKQKR